MLTVMERQLHYVMDLLHKAFDVGIRCLEVREDVFAKYNDEIDALHQTLVWTHQGMDTYYRNSRGRVVVNNPLRVVDFWQRTAEADLADFVAVGPTGPAPHRTLSAELG